MSNRDAVLGVLRWASGGVVARPGELEAALDDIPARLLPLVAEVALEDGAGRSVESADRLERALGDATVAWLVRSRVVTELVGGLDRHGIRAIFLKGVALAEQVYARPALRPMSDVDAWVRSDQLHRVLPALEPCGFRVPDRYRGGFPHHGDVPTLMVEPAFGPAPVLIEIHGLPYSLSELSEGEIDAMWRRSGTLRDSGIRVLHPEDQLLHVCLHMSRKSPFLMGLPALVDVTLMVRHMVDSVDWARFVSCVRDMRRAGSVWTVLRLARDMLGAPVPDFVLADLAVPDPEGLLAAAEEQIWSSQPELPAAIEHAFGGGGTRSGWFWYRTIGKHWMAAGRSIERIPARVAATSRHVTRDVWVQVGRYMARLLRGDFVRPAFWRSAFAARRRGRLLRMLERVDRESAPHG